MPHPLLELLAQHEQLRVMMDRCEDLADAIDAGEDPRPLADTLAQLRLAFDAHNKYETQELRPLLLAGDPHGTQRVDRMMEDHVEEHRVIHTKLGSPATMAMREVLETLRAHLDAEERYLLSSQVLRAAAR